MRDYCARILICAMDPQDESARARIVRQQRVEKSIQIYESLSVMYLSYFQYQP